MTMTLKEVHPTMLVAKPYRHECRGHDPAKKESVKADDTYAVGKVRTCTLLITVCSYIEQNTKE